MCNHGTNAIYLAQDGTEPVIAPQPADFTELLRDACTEVTESSLALYDAFRISDPGGRWDMDVEAGLFTFTHADGARCRAGFDIVGSWIEGSGSWMWGWGLPGTHISEETRQAADGARAYGRRHGFQPLTEKMLSVPMEEAWHLTNIAARLAARPMVYSAPVNGKVRLFFAIGPLAWVH